VSPQVDALGARGGTAAHALAVGLREGDGGDVALGQGLGEPEGEVDAAVARELLVVVVVVVVERV
jgi:hypothetical protein